MLALRKERYSHFCLRCEYEWFSKLIKPKKCAGCNNPYWDIPRK